MFPRGVTQVALEGKLESVFLEMLDIYQLKNFQSSQIPWLPLSQDYNLDNNHRPPSLDFIKTLFLQAVCASVPKFLAGKYHKVNIAELIKNSGVEWNYGTLSSMFMMDCEVFGIPLMKTINRELHHSDKFRKQEKNKNKRKQLESRRVMVMVMSLQTTYGGVGVKPILDTDYCSSAKEFMLEPCILIQLPWKPVVLQQWLLGGLAEVMMFERESLELRHWPLPAEMKDHASEVLTLVRNLKSRIILGFAIMGRMTHTYPVYDPKFPQLLLEHVVLPSVPVLEFLITGKAHKIVKNIKKISWTDPEIETKFFVHESSYIMNKELEQFNVSNFYSFFTWSQIPMTKIFPNPDFDIQEIGNKIKNVTIPPKHVKSTTKCLSLEEVKLLELLEKNQSKERLHVSRQDKVRLTVEFIVDTLVATNKIPGLTVAMLINIFMLPQNNRLTDEIYDVSKTNHIILSIRQVLMSVIALNRRTEIQEFDSNAVTSVMCLQLQCLEREQQVRLAFTCSQIFKLKLHLKNVAPNTILDCESLLKQITEVKQRIVNSALTSLSLFSRLPKEWKGNVVKDEKVTLYNMSTLQSESNAVVIVKQLQDRIGRLVFNISTNNSNAVMTTGGEIFPHFSIVQYLLPLFVAAISEHEKRFGVFLEPKTKLYSDLFGSELCKPMVAHLNVINLAHNLIKHYENLFLEWCSKDYKLHSSYQTVELNKKLKDPSYYQSYSLIMLKYREVIRHLLLAHTDASFHNYTSMLICYDQVLNFISNWTIMVAHIILDAGPDAIEPSMSVVDAWLHVDSNFVMDLFKICQNVFNHPVAGKVCSKYPELGELHFANVVLNELEVVFEIAVVDREIRDMKTTTDSKDMLTVPNMDQHLNIYRAIVDVQSKDVSSSRLAHVVEEGKKSMFKLYNSLKEFRKKSGCILKCSLYEKLPNAHNPKVRKAVQYYINGNLDALDKMLTVFKIPYVKKCRQCGTTTGDLRACKDCIKENFPDVNYFCSKKCREVRWKAEHMEEHLDFELGLSEHPEQEDDTSTSEAGATMKMKDLQI